jgi:hypothetical protein
LFTDVHDPLLSESYGEFPLDSLDILIDRAEQEIMKNSNEGDNNSTSSSSVTGVQQHPCPPKRIRIVDIGSGCGRLALYLSLSRGCSNHENYDVQSSDKQCYYYDIHGIEISSIFHQKAIQATQRAVEYGVIHETIGSNENHEQLCAASTVSRPDARGIKTSLIDNNTKFIPKNTLQFHCGSATDFVNIMAQADILFCYSTAFPSNPNFCVELGAMTFNTFWNELFTQVAATSSSRQQKKNHNQKMIVITTEKAIDPKYHWTLIDRINVPNPEVFGSTGYIQKPI